MTHAAEIADADPASPADRAWQTPLLQTSVLVPMSIALGSLLAGAIYTWFIGEDVNWDWLNYHEYNVWAVINDRYGIDAMPAGAEQRRLFVDDRDECTQRVFGRGDELVSGKIVEGGNTLGCGHCWNPVPGWGLAS